MSINKPNMVVHTHNASCFKGIERRSWSEAGLGKTARPYLENKNSKELGT
jgi:hypothetical protein